MTSRAAVHAGAALVAAALSIAASAARPDGDHVAALDGAELFQIKGCATCHNGPTTRATIGVGPSLEHAANWAGARVEGLSAEQYVAQSMAEPSAFISPAYAGGVGPSVGMPLLQLSSDEIEALVAYILDTQPRTTLDNGTGSE